GARARRALRAHPRRAQSRSRSARYAALRSAPPAVSNAGASPRPTFLGRRSSAARRLHGGSPMRRSRISCLLAVGALGVFPVRPTLGQNLLLSPGFHHQPCGCVPYGPWTYASNPAEWSSEDASGFAGSGSAFLIGVDDPNHFVDDVLRQD